MRSRLDEQLDMLKKEMTSMGILCESAIAKATLAVEDGDPEIAGELPGILTLINQKERDIENLCLRLLMQQQPVARDLREVSSALKMVTDMERIGDQSSDIAEIVLMKNIGKDDDKLLIPEMSKAASKMVTDSIDAFVSKNITLARSVIEYDDIVDNYFDSIKSQLIDKMKLSEQDGEYALDLLMISKYLERIADHAVNIAEWVVFSITGQHEEAK